MEIQKNFDGNDMPIIDDEYEFERYLDDIEDDGEEFDDLDYDDDDYEDIDYAKVRQNELLEEHIDKLIEDFEKEEKETPETRSEDVRRRELKTKFMDLVREEKKA